jgi:hypothetical protein
MSLLKSLADRAKALEERQELVRKFIARPIGSKRVKEKAAKLAAPQTSHPPAPMIPLRPQRDWAGVRAGAAPLEYFSRTGNQALSSQPWTRGLVNALLEAADQGTIHLALIWPAKLNSLPLIHALANVERNFARDLRGLRTLLFPGSHSSRSTLQGTLANRKQLAKFYQSVWVTQGNANTTEETCTSSPSFLAALGALNDIQNRHPDVANPSLAELVPAFVFDTSEKGWSTPVASPLKRTLSKVEKLAHRRDLRDKVNIEWPDPNNAPGALMVLHCERLSKSAATWL